MKIFIDPGHNYGGADTGAGGFGLREERVSFAIADKLRNLLVSAGYDVKMSRNAMTDNVGDGSLNSSLSTRARLANDWGADLFVSIHCNAGSGTGTETLVYGDAGKAAGYAGQILDAICSRLDLRSRGVKQRSELAVLKYTTMPAVLVETAFIDNEADAWLLKTDTDGFAAAIFEGITGVKPAEKGNGKVARTVMELSGTMYIQEIAPCDFEIMQCDCSKKDISLPNYFNCGYFTTEKDGKTIPVGHLASNGDIFANAKEQASWINVAGKALTTIYTTTDGAAHIDKIDDIAAVRGLKTAVSGIPIIAGGKYVGLDEIKSEGYFGNEDYDTWHGFLGIRSGKLVYVAMKCGFDAMCWALVALGIYDAIKLDGGGSFILKNGDILQATGENRRIQNVGVWKA